MGYNLHLELASRCTFSVRASCRAKPRLRTQNASQNVRPETGKQHGLASSRTPFFDLRSMHNVASRTYKKRRFCSCGAQFAPPIAFEMHRWHLPLRLGVTTGKTTTSDPKAFPKRLAPEQGNSMAWRAQGHRFFDLRWNHLQCQTLRPEPIKKEDFAAVGHLQCLRNAPLAPSVAFGRHDGQNHDFWPKSLPKKAGPGTGKQHGLASSRTPFFDLRWNHLQCQTLRPEPIKKEDFAAVGLNLHLQLPSKCTVGTFRCVWASRRAKPRLLTQKPSQKGSPRNRETAWPGELKDTVFRPALEWSSMSNVASRTYKKRRFCSCGAQFAPPIAFEMHRWHLPLRLGVTTGKTPTSDPKAFPKRLAPEQGNSMAWRAQGHRFSTCVGIIFNVKRCVQNL